MPATDAETYLRRARLALDELDGWFSPLKRRWKTTGWWNAAAILATFIRFAKLTGDDGGNELLLRIHEKRWRRGRRNFLNRYYDDEGWWAATWLEAWEWTGSERYLETAALLFADMCGGWSDACGGGICWRKGGRYKAAIANSLFIHVAAQLYLSTDDAGYLGEARRCRTWFDESGLTGADGLVRDGVDRGCAPAGDIWSYNQGAMIGAAVGLARGVRRSGDEEAQSLTKAATRTAHAVIDKLAFSPAEGRRGMASPGGVLRERGEPGLNKDAVQFKGLTMRFLVDFWRETNDERVAAFIQNNADSLWAKAREPGTNRVGASWVGPFDRADAGRQGSACDALVAAATVASASGRRSV